MFDVKASNMFLKINMVRCERTVKKIKPLTGGISVLKDTRVVKDAVFLIDDKTLRSRSNVQSGWDYDDRGAVKPDIEGLGGMVLCTDESNEYDVHIKREVVPTKQGKAGFFMSFALYYGDGFKLRFFDTSDKEKKVSFEIATEDGLITVNSEKIPVAVEKKTYSLGIDFDIDKKKAVVYFDDVNYGTFKMTGKGISSVVLSLDADKKTCMVPLTARMWVNYLICDRCFVTPAGPLSDVWRFKAEGKATADRRHYTEGQNLVTYAIVTADSKRAVLERKFSKADGVVCFEMKYLPKKDNEKIEISLTDGKKAACTLVDNGHSVSFDGKVLREHHVNVWQTLRIEANTKIGKALIKVNGKKCGYIELDNDCEEFDGIRIAFSAHGGGCLKFTDIYVFKILPEPEDYVPAPILPKKKDYFVGMNVCSLWRNGDHWGWDTVSPYDENHTYMGYYDEGLAEVADWEIKWMLEHGLDFELYCWYNNQVNAPITKTGLSAAIHDGHFNAKYGDMMRFAIIWEAANCAHAGIEGFRNHVVPYWMDYFFSDPRYFTIDNKVLISVFGSGQLIKDFGSEEAVKAQLDYVREQVKTLGYDGAIFMSCSAPSESVKNCGFDAVYAYNWGTEGYSPDYTKSRITEQREKNILHVVPTVSTGFNSIGWDRPRTPLMTCEDMGEMLRWFKEDVLPDNKGEDWKRKFVMFSTWNEYGEGTYICPANLNGFGYLDEMRKAFTDEPKEHTDVRPNEHQLDRLGYLYPKGRSLLRTQQYTKPVYPDECVGKIDISKDKWNAYNGLELWEKDGKLCGKGDKFDPQFLRTDLDIDSSAVLSVRMRIKAGTLTGGSESVSMYFITENDTTWSESKGANARVTPKEFLECNFNFSRLPTWKGKITGLRIDPTGGAGEFEIESIELMTDTKTPIILVDGKPHTASVLPMIKKTGVYIPFEQNRPYENLKFYHEWYRDERTLYLVHKDKKMYFTEGKKYVIVNGEKYKLPEPLEFYDSLPMLSLDALCDICGFTYELDGRYIKITSDLKA